MEQFIGCDAHKKFSLFVAMNEDGETGARFGWGMIEKSIGISGGLTARVANRFGNQRDYYWMVDEMERAGHQPRLAHPLTPNGGWRGGKKTDKRDARGLGDVVAQWNVAARMDSASGVAGSAGNAAVAHELGTDEDAAEEPHPRRPGCVTT